METRDHPVNAAEALLLRLKANGVRYVFANGGTDFPPIIEGIAHGMARGADLPEIVIAPHETAAVGMAHGYYLMTGDAQALMVHVNVGLGQLRDGPDQRGQREHSHADHGGPHADSSKSPDQPSAIWQINSNSSGLILATDRRERRTNSQSARRGSALIALSVTG